MESWIISAFISLWTIFFVSSLVLYKTMCAKQFFFSLVIKIKCLTALIQFHLTHLINCTSDSKHSFELLTIFKKKMYVGVARTNITWSYHYMVRSLNSCRYSNSYDKFKKNTLTVLSRYKSWQRLYNVWFSFSI